MQEEKKERKLARYEDWKDRWNGQIKNEQWQKEYFGDIIEMYTTVVREM